MGGVAGGLVIGLVLAVYIFFIGGKSARELKNREKQIGTNGYTRLMWASWAGMNDVVNELIGRGQNINEQDSSGYTPLMHACSGSDYTGVIIVLLNCGADLEIRNKNGDRAIDMARRLDHKNQIAALENGPDITLAKGH